MKTGVANTPLLCRLAAEPGWLGESEASQVSCIVASAPCYWERHDRTSYYKPEHIESNEGNYSEFGKNRLLMPHFLSLSDYLRELFFFSLNIDQLPNVCLILHTNRCYMKKKRVSLENMLINRAVADLLSIFIPPSLRLEYNIGPNAFNCENLAWFSCLF